MNEAKAKVQTNVPENAYQSTPGDPNLTAGFLESHPTMGYSVAFAKNHFRDYRTLAVLTGILAGTLGLQAGLGAATVGAIVVIPLLFVWLLNLYHHHRQQTALIRVAQQIVNGAVQAMRRAPAVEIDDPAFMVPAAMASQVEETRRELRERIFRRNA